MMLRKERRAALPRLILVVAASTVGRWPPGTTTSTAQSQAPSSVSFAAAEATTAASSLHPQARRAWDAKPRPWVFCRRRGKENHASDARRSLAASSGLGCRLAENGRSSNTVVPVWIRTRGGAGTRVDGRTLDSDFGESAEDEKREGVVGEEGEGLEEALGDTEEEEQEESEGEEDEDVVDTAAVDDSDEENQENGKDKGTEKAGGGEEIGSSGVQDASVAQTLELGKVLPALIKQGVVFAMGTWLAKNLSPAVTGQVRAARMIYTAYLIFSQALCMYLRYLIWKKDDNSEMVVPPPAQLKKMMEGIGGANVSGGATAGSSKGATAAADGADGAAAALAPMLDKMMTLRTPVKKYDMKVVQGIRRGQFWASLFMCYTHLKRGMIKPMMLQVSFGMLSLLDSPLFKIYVLGQAAEGELARPFKKQGLMASLTGPMEGLAAKAESARVAAEAEVSAAKAAATRAEDQGEGSSDGDDGENDGDEAMPDIEVLTDAEESD